MKKINLKKGDLVCIEWLDAFSDSDWVQVEDIPDAMPVVSVGFVLKTDCDRVVIAQTTCVAEDNNNPICNYMSIPKGMIEDYDIIKDKDYIDKK